MATIDSRAAIDNIIAHNGAEYADEPPVVMIVEYLNGWGKSAWGVVFENEGMWGLTRYLEETEYVRNPRVIWRRDATENTGQ